MGHAHDDMDEKTSPVSSEEARILARLRSERVPEPVPVSRRTQIIREQQRSGRGEVTAIMVSRCDMETASGGLLGAVHSLFHGSDLGCAYGGMSCPVRVKAERLLRVTEEARISERRPLLRPRSDYHEDCGDVLWWHLPIDEPPHYGSPLNSDWEEGFDDYYTHWSSVTYPVEAMAIVRTALTVSVLRVEMVATFIAERTTD